MLLQLGLPDVLIRGGGAAHNITYITPDCTSNSSRALTTKVVRANYQCLSACTPIRWIFMKPYTAIF